LAKEYKIRKLYYDEEMSLSDTVIQNEGVIEKIEELETRKEILIN